MCGRHYVEPEATALEMMGILAEIRRRYDQSPQLPLLTTGEIAPSQVAAVIANSKNMNHRPILMKWGYTGFKSKSHLIINARSESVDSRSMFKDSLYNRRCLIPANKYYEWQNLGKNKQKYSLFPQEQTFFCMAGLYRFESDPSLPSFVILTRDAPGAIKDIHHRMPVILPKSEWNNWLEPIYDPLKVIEQAVLDIRIQKSAT